MEKRSFLKLFEIVSVHRMFNKMSYNQCKRFKSKQAPVWIQLMVALIRVGCYGNGVSVGRVGVNCGYSDGSVDNFTNYSNFSSKTNSNKLAKNRGEKVIDGTHCILAQKPKIDGGRFFLEVLR